MRTGFYSLKAKHKSVANLINSDPNDRGGKSFLQYPWEMQDAFSIVWVRIQSSLYTCMLTSIHISVYMMPGTQR